MHIYIYPKCSIMEDTPSKTRNKAKIPFIFIVCNVVLELLINTI